MHAIGVGAGRYECRGVNLASQKVTRILVFLVDVFGVRSEAERHAAQLAREPGDRRRAVAEMSVQMCHLRKTKAERQPQNLPAGTP